jgi:hypothetical protein
MDPPAPYNPRLGESPREIESAVERPLSDRKGLPPQGSSLPFLGLPERHLGRAFMRAWIQRVKRSRIAPLIKVVNMIATHEGLILNWIRARREVFTGATEGFNNKARVGTRRSYGFRTFPVMELVLYHTLRKLPEPKVAHILW